MILLSIDTSAAYVSIALLSQDKVLANRFEPMERGQGEALIPMIQELLKTADVSVRDLSAVAVAVGPGSFTGVRVGLSAARAIALALSIPVMGVSNFESVAFGLSKPLMVLLDTKRGDYYAQFFNADGTVSEPNIQTNESLKQYLPFTAAGDGAILAQQEIACSVINNSLESAVCVGKVALSRLDNPMPAEPFYLRGADVSV